MWRKPDYSIKSNAIFFDQYYPMLYGFDLRLGEPIAMAITLRQIEAFRAVMEAGTVIEGASSMRLSQPAVSRLIGDLEASLGYSLFARVRGRLVPTDEAQVLY